MAVSHHFFPSLFQSSILIPSPEAHLQLQSLWLGKGTVKGHPSVTLPQVHPHH